jgi:hypothetical protein
MKPLSVNLSGKTGDGYHEAPPVLYILEGNVEREGFYRTGITPPGYPTRAVYARKFTTGEQDHYVLDGGQLWERREWCQEHTGVKP